MENQFANDKEFMPIVLMKYWMNYFKLNFTIEVWKNKTFIKGYQKIKLRI